MDTIRKLAQKRGKTHKQVLKLDGDWEDEKITKENYKEKYGSKYEHPTLDEKKEQYKNYYNELKISFYNKKQYIN